METLNHKSLIFNEKNKYFIYFGVVIGPPKPSKMRFLGILGGLELPLNEKNIIFFHKDLKVHSENFP